MRSTISWIMVFLTSQSTDRDSPGAAGSNRGRFPSRDRQGAVLPNSVKHSRLPRRLAAVATHQGAYLSDMRPQQESRLPSMPGASRPERHIRSIPVTVSSKTGCLFSSKDLSDYNRPR
jgi:hypothetical protein